MQILESSRYTESILRARCLTKSIKKRYCKYSIFARLVAEEKNGIKPKDGWAAASFWIMLI